jgi:hypothetical protein
MLDVCFKPVFTKDNVEMFCGFFTALRHFSLDAFEKDEGVLDTILFRNLSVRFVSLKDVECEMAIIFKQYLYKKDRYLNKKKITKFFIKIGLILKRILTGKKEKEYELFDINKYTEHFAKIILDHKQLFENYYRTFELNELQPLKNPMFNCMVSINQLVSNVV